MSVIHIKTAHEDWKDDPKCVYIGRPSKWGNPFSVDKYGRDKCIELHRKALVEEDGELHHLMNDLGELKGKTLVCFCAPLPCHGDTLAELADML